MYIDKPRLYSRNRNSETQTILDLLQPIQSELGQHVIDVDKKGLKQRDEPFDLVLENTAARVLPDKPAYKDLPLGDELPCDMPPKQSSHAMASERPCTQLLQAVQGSPDQSPPPHPVSVTVQ
jgi:hypothetical protein